MMGQNMNYSQQTNASGYATGGVEQESFAENIISSVSRVSGVVVLVAGFVGLAMLILL